METESLNLAFIERLTIARALIHCDGNRTHAARELGISVRTLQRKLKANPGIAHAISSDEVSRCTTDAPC